VDRAPFGALIYMLLQGYSPGRAAGIALAMLAAGVLWRHGPMRGLYLLVDGLILGARASAPLIVAAAAAGIVIAMVYLSGLGLRFTSTIVAIAGDNLLLCLVLVALATLILGMGLPITAAYLTAATLAVPPLKLLGVTDLAGHMFVFYFAALSAITPPVALASYAAAGVAGASFWTTSILAVRIGLIAFVVPFVFVYRPALLLWGAAPETVAYVVVTSLVGITAVSCAMVGYLNGRLTAAERLLLAVCAAVLIVLPRFDLDIACIAIVAALAVFRYVRPGPVAGR
jgi:TRAP-type uncharacterized transport system fused permease subunit